MTPNQGQWDNRIQYSIPLNSGKVYIENSGLNYFLYHHQDAHDGLPTDNKTEYHAIKQSFLNCNVVTPKNIGEKSDHYSNFLIGNDSSKWKHHVYDFKEVQYINFYEGIDAYYSTSKNQLEYSFRIYKGANPKEIKFSIEGSDGCQIDKNGNLIINHRFGSISQSKPKAWILKNESKKELEVQFKIKDDIVSFSFPNGIPDFDEIYIDPSLTFSTFTGSSADNWGFTATPDGAGNLYGAGIVFGYGYPFTNGSYDITYNNGVGGLPFDLGVTKFNPSGTALLFSTYLGGSGNETPHSIVCGTNGELYIYGVTCSPDFPMTNSSYDPTFSGGPTENENSLTFTGSDIYVSKLSTNGSTLLASTYLGGTGTDGLNTNNLHYNYGDQFRGEVILDGNGNVYISSTSASINFPTTPGVYSSVLNGLQDAVVCKLNNSLSALTWSTFFGGIGEETGNSIEVSPSGFVYVAGGSTSPNFPNISTGNDLSNNGGLSDGYVIRLNPLNGSVVSGTFMGMNEYDQSYFVRCDPSNQVYVYGQTESNWAITPGCYGTPNSGQFLRKYDTNLQNVVWSTVFGAGSGHVEISPTAFLISDCYEIYVAGWGGTLNANSSVSQALYSTTNGFAVSPNAFQGNTNGSNFYLSVFSQDAQAMNYGTYMGGVASSSNHVDGGTSRFDKSGRIYHAVCGACGGNNFGFTSTPGSWSPQNPSPNCNMAVFKFELSTLVAVVAMPVPLICLPQPVYFNNNSVNGNTYSWNFGDNTTSNLFQPTHLYNTPGIYTVTLIVSDSANCYVPDTAVIQVNIGDFQGGVTIPSSPICPGDSLQLDAFGGSTYLWSPANFLNNPNIANPIATVYSNTVFTVIISDSCGSDTLQVPLNVVPMSMSISPDTSICIGGSALLNVTGTGAVSWISGTGLNTNTGANVIATPDSSELYIAQLTSQEGCVLMDSVNVSVYYNPPSSSLPDTVVICQGSSSTLNVTGATSFFWSPNISISTTLGPTVTLYPANDMYYYCTFINACGSIIDSVYATVLLASITAGNDTIICPNQVANLWAEGGIFYQWSPSQFIVNQTGNQVWVQPTSSTLFQVIGIDNNGCVDSAYAEVVLHPMPSISISPNVQAFYGETIQLNAEGNGTGSYVWSPPEYLSCINCPNPIAQPDQDYTYQVTFTDLNGCVAAQTINISYNPVIYVPNCFIPDDNGRNDGFGVSGGNIASMELFIFNRWGELICTLHSMEETWNGSFDGKPCPDGAYTWKLNYTDSQENKFLLTGHVILIR